MLLFQFMLLVLQNDCFFAIFVLYFSESLLFKFYFLVLMIQVFLNLIELHLMGKRTVVELREDVQRLAVINVDTLHSQGSLAWVVRASLLNDLGRVYFVRTGLSYKLIVDMWWLVQRGVLVLLIAIELLHQCLVMIHHRLTSLMVFTAKHCSPSNLNGVFSVVILPILRFLFLIVLYLFILIVLL